MYIYIYIYIYMFIGGPGVEGDLASPGRGVMVQRGDTKFGFTGVYAPAI